MRDLLLNHSKKSHGGILDTYNKLSAEAEGDAALRAKRERVKEELSLLLQIGYVRKARPYKKVREIIDCTGVDSERDPLFLDRLQDHIHWLSLSLAGSIGEPKKLTDKGLKELYCWILEQKDSEGDK